MREPISLLPLALLALAVLAVVAATGAGTAAPAPAAVDVEAACDLELDVADPDPKGLNVRATPAGKVIARLLPDGEWTEVHVVAQRGEWLRIDRADTVDDDAESGMREVFRGDGWVHASGLGVSELNVGGGTALRAAPDDAAEILRTFSPDNEPKRTRILGCRGAWLQVDADGLQGWTTTWCNNQRTTCS